MKTTFEPVYLKRGSYFSKWDASVITNCSNGEVPNKGYIVLPPLKPAFLQICIRCFYNGINFDEVEMQKVRTLVRNGSEFWESSLLYDLNAVKIHGGEIIMELECRTWSMEKMVTFFEKPASLRAHLNLPGVTFLKKLSLECKLYSKDDENASVCIEDLIPQFNEYFSSLIISQLEFRFPMVFSAMGRLRFQQQSADLCGLSYALTNTSSLLPLLVKLIADDRTTTTVYYMTDSHARREKNTVKSFQILRRV